MKRSTVILAIVALIAIIGLIAIFSQSNEPTATDSGGGTTSAPHETTNPGAINTSGSGAATGGSSYTLAEVQKHNSQSSCWTAINGNVYDLTSWISQHPGGEGAILSICGTDGSAAFAAQHGSQRRPNQELAMFLIGALSQ